MPETNRAIVLRRYPSGAPEQIDFEIVEQALPSLQEGQVAVRVEYLSMDPAPRMRMNSGARFPPALPLGETVVGRGSGVVSASRHPSFAPGDAVIGELGWQEHAVVGGAQLRMISPPATLRTSLGVLGPSGITAWCLIHAAACVKPNDTVIVAAAAGSVGMVAVQLAQLAGARVVGIVGSDRQAEFVVKKLGAAAAVNYHSANLDAELGAACPQGAQVFLDSVGGELHEAALKHIADHARIVAFGFIASYHATGEKPRQYGDIYQLIRRRASLQGFLIADYAALFNEAVAQLGEGLSSGQIKNSEECHDGLDSVPAAFAALFGGDPIGKQLVSLRPKPPGRLSEVSR